MVWILLIAFALFTGVEGLYEGIDDITNNLATDLAPLITLFGEQVTKQFLSESTGLMDSIILSIAPLGLFTLVVSVIRIYGNASIKSIIGRSQEAQGVAEADLCSFTSQDVCELWTNGGICRVLGRPKILCFLYDNTTTKDDFYPTYKKDQRQYTVEEGPTCGIYRPNTLFFSTDEEMSQKMGLLGWREVPSNRWTCSKLLSRLLGTKPNDRETKSEPSANPNLALNIGSRCIDRRIHWSVFTFSVLLQLSFFGYAAWATFYDSSILNDGGPPPQAKLWFGLTISGNSMLVFGNILCARLINLKSRERRFKNDGGTSRSEMFWLQPGGQSIGDRLFPAFAYSECRDEYTTSERAYDMKRESMVLLAVISTLSGWALQFVGLRGSPGSIALFQFIATLVMSFLRAVLRMGHSRMGRDMNRLEYIAHRGSNLLGGHELDWQAMNIDKDDQHHGELTFLFSVIPLAWLMREPIEVMEWRLSDHFPDEDQDVTKEDNHEGVTVVANKYFRAYYAGKDDHTAHKRAANFASDWIAAQEAEDSSASRRDQHDPSRVTRINPAARIMRFRSRLAKLTSAQYGLPPEQAWGSEIRTIALQLQRALQVSAKYVFAQIPLKQAWKGESAPKAIAWKALCQVGWLDRTREQQAAENYFTIAFQMYNSDGEWRISSHQLEAVLGLWSWSLKRSAPFGPAAEEILTRSKDIVIETSKRDDIEAALYRWVGSARPIRGYGAMGGISRPDNLSIPTSSLLSRVQSSGAFRRMDARTADGFTILGILTDSRTSLLQLMAQDIYTIFINRIVNIIGDLHLTRGPEDYLTMRDQSVSTAFRATQLPELTNPHIDELASVLFSTGVATREEALMTIVPAFMRQRKLPQLDKT